MKLSFAYSTLFCSLLMLSFVGGKKMQWISDTSHDFGSIEQGKTVVHTFIFQNTSQEPLTIDNVRTACGCTSPLWEEALIEPDSTGTIKLEFDATKIGYFQKEAKVFFHGQRKAERLTIMGEVVAPD